MKRRGGYQAFKWQLKKHVKRNVVIDVEKEEEEEGDHNNNNALRSNAFEINEDSDDNLVRRWEELDHDILVSIMQRLDRLVLAYVACFVCKTWLDAVLDTLFPPQDVLNLGSDLIYGLIGSTRRRFWSLTERQLNRKQATYYTKLVLPDLEFSQWGYKTIAQRLPSLKSIDLRLHPHRLNHLFDFRSYWKKLVEVECDVSSLDTVSYLWNQINTIKLCGAGGAKETHALILAERFPNLTHLSLRDCELMGNAIYIILEGRMNLVYLDTTHATLHDREVPWVVKDWDESLLIKANGIAQFVRCEMRNCPRCYRKYHPLEVVTLFYRTFFRSSRGFWLLEAYRDFWGF